MRIRVEKSMKFLKRERKGTKSWFFEKVNKIDKPPIGLIKKKKKKDTNYIPL